MKIGMCMFLWTTSVSKKHEALLRDIKATGFDGVEGMAFIEACVKSSKKNGAWTKL